MTSPFEKHGIHHLSASSLALYRKEPALWIVRYLYGARDEGANAAIWRGKAVEAAADHFLFSYGTEESSIEVARNVFLAGTLGMEMSDKAVKERDALPGFVKQTIEALKPLGKPVAKQVPIELFLEDIEIPLIGYIDYLYEDDLIDLKTTNRIPSEPRYDHVIQVGIYATATQKDPHLLYTSAKRAVFYECTDAGRTMDIVRRTAKAVRTLLDKCSAKEEAASLFTPNFDNTMYWDEKSKKLAEGIF